MKELVAWPEARSLLATQPGLSAVPRQIAVLRADRTVLQTSWPFPGAAPERVGADGQTAPALLALAGEDGLRQVNEFLRRLNIQIELHDRRRSTVAPRDEFEILARGAADEPVPLRESGAGVAFLLPLVVAAQLTPSEHAPDLYCLEQPELQLHPRAHAAVADLLLDLDGGPPGGKVLEVLVENADSDGVLVRLAAGLTESTTEPAGIPGSDTGGHGAARAGVPDEDAAFLRCCDGGPGGDQAGSASVSVRRAFFRPTSRKKERT